MITALPAYPCRDRDPKPEHRARRERVTVVLDVRQLVEGVERVDRPGTGSVHARSSAASEAPMGAAIFVLRPADLDEQARRARPRD